MLCTTRSPRQAFDEVVSPLREQLLDVWQASFEPCLESGVDGLNGLQPVGYDSDDLGPVPSCGGRLNQQLGWIVSVACCV